LFIIIAKLFIKIEYVYKNNKNKSANTLVASSVMRSANREKVRMDDCGDLTAYGTAIKGALYMISTE